ncbi:oxidoreductase [Salinigranum rubrum]|uniref:Oxidoreductase n=1 Tax=Salinigranum rubrum TaxID=755307 RepID=A0A2I8VPL7_9EURY|nr:SDR family NAD(P)-dependent oxidoreductase [Salinigranum rubrum]AUV83059.1 oxidoreductase [Salinigranum rubrum]
MPSLSNTTALVTGASRGVGRGIALALGDAGATVYVTGRSVDADRTDDLPGTVDETAEAITERGGRGIAVQCDHTDDQQVEALFDRIDRDRDRGEVGALDLLVNNVWGGYEGYGESFDDPFWEQSVETWDRMFDAGVRAHFTASRLAVPRLLDAVESNGGLVVTVSSGHGGRYRGNVPYDVSKTATERLTRAMAYDLRDAPVSTVAVQPGFTRTERVLDAIGDDPEALAETESPLYTGRAVVALAADSRVAEKSGGVFRVGELAREYGFTDVDGSQPAPFDLPGDPL